MTKTGNTLPLSFFLSCFVWLIFIPKAQAQDFDLSASLSEDQVFIGEQFTLQVEIRGESLRNTNLPQLPPMDGLRLLTPNPARSQSISIVNGQTTTITSYTYTFIAREKGEYQIPALTMEIDGEENRTPPLTLTVLEQDSFQGDGERRPDIFARIELDDEEPVVGQQLIASLVLYFKSGVEVTSYQPTPGWRTDGFWKEQLENIDQPQAETVILGNVRYRKATLLRYALFPSRSGNLTLSPFELQLGIRTDIRRNDPFGSVFGGLGTNQRRVSIETESTSVQVNTLPAPETDAETLGAVGRFDIDRRASVTQARVGESIEIITTLSGEGNLPLINKPAHTFPDHFEVYSPREEQDLDRRGMTISGTRTFRDRFVPRTTGMFTLPAKKIAVYDPENHTWTYRDLPPITIDVVRDPAESFAGSDEQSPLRLMTGGAVWQNSGTGTGLPIGLWGWIGLLLPAVALALAWRQKRLQQKLDSDAGFARAHQAWDRVEETLLKAEEAAVGTHPKEAYHLLHKAITGYVADWEGLPAAGLSDQEICEVISQKTGDANLSRRTDQILTKSANITYAPVENTEDILSDIHQTRELLKQLRARL